MVFFLCHLLNNDHHHLMSINAVTLGVSAMAAVMMLKNGRVSDRTRSAPSACSSAMVSDTVSARASETVVEEVEEDLMRDLWGLTDEGEEQMRKASIPKSEEQSERVRKAKQAVQPVYVESLGSKGIGRTIPVIGRDVQTSAQPKVTGGCMFYMSDRYTRALEEQ